MDPPLERRFHMREKLQRMKREINEAEFKAQGSKNSKNSNYTRLSTGILRKKILKKKL